MIEPQQEIMPKTIVPPPIEIRAAEPTLNNGKKEVVFIDSSLDDYQTLIGGVDAGIEIRLIDGTKDGLAQINAWAQTHSGYDALHILSHGSSGNILLGTTELTNYNIVEHSQELTNIGNSLTESGDILLYGCNVANGATGIEFINKLSQITNADIASSDDLTGNSALGGDWVLEVPSGSIEAYTVEANSYSGIFAIPQFNYDQMPADGLNDYTATVLKNSNGSTDYTMWSSSDTSKNIFFWGNANNDLTYLLNIDTLNTATTWSIVTGPSHGTLSNTLSTTSDAGGGPSSGTLIYTPTSDFTGNDSIVVSATTSGGTDTMTININTVEQHQLGGVAATGNLDVHVGGGQIYITRYNGTAWEQQYFSSSGAVIAIDGKQYALGSYYTMGTTHYIEEAKFVSQTKSGTQITTTWDAGGFLVDQIVELPTTTSKYIKLNYEVTNNSGSDASDVRLFRGIDSYLAGGDSGAGFWDAATNTIGVTKDVGGISQVLRFQGITTPTWYSSKAYYEVGTDFVENNVLYNDTNPDPTVDNGYALGWQKTSFANGSDWTIKTYESFTSAPVTVAGGDLESSTGSAVTLTYTISNKSGVSQDVTYSAIAPTGWNIDSISKTTETITNNSTSTVTITLTPQSGSTAGLYDVTLIAQTSGGDDQGIGQVNVTVPPGPSVTTPTAASYTDTSANDTFSNDTGTISATASSGSITGYGINGGTTGGTDNIGGTIYDIYKVGTYGTLYVKSSDGNYVYVPNATAINAVSANQSETFSVQATDSNGTGSAILTVNVTGANDAPSLSTPTAASYTDTTANDTFTNTTGTLSASDRDSGATLTYGITGGTTGGSTNVGGTVYDVSKAGTYGTLYVKSSDGSYVFVPSNSVLNGTASGATPSETFTMSVSDGTTSATQTYTVNVTGANDSPIISGTPANATVSEDTASNLNLSAITLSESDGDTLTVTLTASAGTMAASSGGGVSVGGSASGTLTLTGTASAIDTFLNTSSNIQYTSASNVSGNSAATITITATDGNGGSLASNPSVTINVTGVNDAPTVANTISDQTASVDSAFSYQFASNTFNDIDGDTLTYTATLANGNALPAWLSFNAGTRTFSGTPASGDAGTISVKVTATDNGTGTLSVFDTFDISVSANPTVTISIDDDTLKSGQTGTVTFTFSEAPTGFADGDITVTGGTLSSLSATDSTHYTATFTPTPNTANLTGSISIAAAAFTGSGNDSLASNTLSITGDTLVPTAPTITSLASSSDSTPTLTGTTEANATVTVVVAGATYTTTANGSGVWSVDTGSATPNSGTLAINANGNNSVSVTATDTAGNISTAATQTLAIDTTAPLFQSAATNSDGTKVILTYDSTLYATTAGTSDFTVQVAGQTVVVSSVAVSGSTVELTLASAITNAQTVTVAYTAPASNNATSNSAV